ncbi:MAG: hypothetical protein JO027_17205 [Solirubrobacterales bacterium]|nr:hypothetical protein [Solirubrobacterales bacterium]
MRGWIAIRLIRLAAAAVPVLLLAACGGSGGSGGSGTSTMRRIASVADPPRCVPAAIHNGAPPSWTDAAWAESSPGFRVPYALASGGAAAAFFFAPTLRAGHPTNPSNKVLWVVRYPRNGNPLEIVARLGRDPSELVRSSWPADSFPGEIYPSGVDLPTPGCWHLELTWGSHRASVDVEVHPPRRS